MKYMYTMLLVFSLQQVHSQSQLSDDFRLGIGFKLQVEFQNLKKISFRASVTGGIGQYLGINGNGFGVLPTVHVGVLVYNTGIIGSQLDAIYKKWANLDFFTNITLTTGGENSINNEILTDRRVPLYHFSDFTVNPLQNNFKHSVSLGTNIISSLDKTRAPQKVGFINFNVSRAVQLSYYNDGGPILRHLGDKKDRYYTGGVIFSGHFDRQTTFNLIEISFHKYTGWQPYAFDASDKLQLDYIPYKDEANFGYNQQQWQISAISYKRGYVAYVKVYDVDTWDVQDILHFSRDNPFHPDYYYSFRIAPGVGYSNFNTTK